MKIYQLIFSLTLILIPFVMSASEITIRPFLIDEVLEPRDQVRKLVTISSDYEVRKAVLYATVNEITIGNDGEIKEFVPPVETDRTNTVTSWIEVSRGRVEIPHGETREVPITLKINPMAEPGEYHAFVGFVEAANRPEAEKIAMEGDAKGVIIKITISDDREESMRINSFLIKRLILSEGDKRVSIELENKGDFTSIPTGEIILYDSRGIEIGSFAVNTKKQEIKPGEIVTVKEKIPLDKKTGRFKANLILEYGESSKANIYDTTYFYLVPIKILLFMILALFIISIFITWLFKRVFIVHGKEQEFTEVTMYVKDGHDANPQDHDIDLKNKS